MSRLDDELKIAFRREEPSPDFFERVLERINSSPAPRPSLRERLAAFFHAPKLRWVAIGATAALLVAISAAVYLRGNQTAVEESAKAVELPVPTKDAGAGQSGSQVDKAEVDKGAGVLTVNQAAANAGQRPPARPKRRTEMIARRVAPRPSPAAEAAKERVLFALQIASATLNDAQKAIQEDGPQEKPEPLNNR
ncbi:MAG TPA: hypothetical protein VJZ26_07405 [Blastocatellia bacterium]|nr:hypothetical protein [Blastocatellia bacterium]